MVDSPVGKKCRDCARNITHIQESTPRQVILAFIAATLVAIPAALLFSHIYFFIGPVLYGGLVGEVALRAGQRRRSLAMQVAAGAAAVLGGLVPVLLAMRHAHGVPADPADAPTVGLSLDLIYPAAMVLVGAAIAVSRVRYL
jgi:hypothetical protein